MHPQRESSTAGPSSSMLDSIESRDSVIASLILVVVLSTAPGVSQRVSRSPVKNSTFESFHY